LSVAADVTETEYLYSSSNTENVFFVEEAVLENGMASEETPPFEMGSVVLVLEVALVQQTLARMVLVEVSGAEVALEVAEGVLARGMDLAVTVQVALAKIIVMALVVVVVASGRTSEAALVTLLPMVALVETRKLQVSEVEWLVDNSFSIFGVLLTLKVNFGRYFCFVVTKCS